DDVVYLVQLGSRFFAEIACFTNGTYLTRELSRRLADAGLSYLCYSRHAADDHGNRRLMGRTAPRLDEFIEAAGALKVRATCVMAKGWVDSRDRVWDYVRTLGDVGVREFTFKHTYLAYEDSLFQGSRENQWTCEHQVAFDPFESE